jgi:hypothetical protein
MKLLFAFLLVIVVNLLPNPARAKNADCPNFRGSFLSPDRIYGEDVSQVEVYQTACRQLTWQHHQYKGGVYLTDPNIHETDGVWRSTGNQKTLSVLLSDRFVTITNFAHDNKIATRISWIPIDGHIRVVKELVKGEITNPIEKMASDRVISTESTLYGRIQGN